MQNDIHPTAIIMPDAVIGKGNLIGPYCYIGSNVTMGDHNKLTSHVVIGSDAQIINNAKTGSVLIGRYNTFREFSTVHNSTDIHKPTLVGDACYFMKGACVNHDVDVATNVVLANDVFLAGHVTVMRNTNIGAGSAIHQHQVIGSFCQLGLGTIVTKKTRVHPGTIYAGNPARYINKNVIGLERNNVSVRLLEIQSKIYEQLINDSGLQGNNEHSSMRVLRESFREQGARILKGIQSRVRLSVKGLGQ